MNHSLLIHPTLGMLWSPRRLGVALPSRPAIQPPQACQNHTAAPGRRSTPLPTASWDQLPRKTHDSAAVRETALSLREKEQGAKSAPVVVGPCSCQVSSCPSSDAGIRPRSPSSQRTLTPSPVEPEIPEAEDIQHRLKQNKETLIESETGKENPT